MKTYVITLSKVFPANHPRAGQSTLFNSKFNAAITHNDDYWNKLHTIRANYPLWKKRFEQINRGEACLSIRQWTGKPYASKQIEIARLTKEDGIGLQFIRFLESGGVEILDNLNFDPRHFRARIIKHEDGMETIAHNDGLSLYDWLCWFRGCDKTKPLAVIHFTPFRY